MKRVLITALIFATASIGLATVAQAVQTSKDSYVHVTPSTYSLDLGTAPGQGYHSVNKVLTLKVDSNCFHGPILISASDLRHSWGSTIPRERIFVRSAATWGFVAMKKSVAVSKPQAGPHEIVLDLQVETEFTDRAGQYQGTLTVTVMPPV